ncbi:hypothetical protein ADUPG1_005631, partial [Aduncisulcus paluster]
MPEEEELKAEMECILQEYREQQKPDMICKAKEFEICLKNPDAVISAAPRKLSPKRRLILEKLLGDLKERGFIQESSSP